MRPRISKKQDIVITFSEMKKYLTENKCFGTTVTFLEGKKASYKFLMMFRNNKKPPVEAEVIVSLVSKHVIFGSIDGVPCASVSEFKERCRWGRS